MTAFRVPFLVGNQHPRDHTSSGFSDAFPGEDPHINLASIMAIAWRVREFTFSGSFSGSATQNMHLSASPSTTWTTAYAFSATVSPTILPVRFNLPAFSGPAVNEIDMTFAYNGWARDGSNVQPVANGTWSMDTAGNPPLRGPTHLSGSFARGVGLIISAIGDYDTNPGVIAAPFIPDLSCNNSDGSGSLVHWLISADLTGGSGFFTIDPVIAPSFHTPMRLTVTGGTVSPGEVQDSFSGSGTCSFSAVASRFWPFANSNGDPIYDETTGAQLRDPFS